MREDCKNYGSSFCSDHECGECPALEFKGVTRVELNDVGAVLVKKYMDYNGWVMLSPSDEEPDYGDYETAAETVRWFMERFKELGYVQIRKGDLYFSREQRTQPDPTKGLYKE